MSPARSRFLATLAAFGAALTAVAAVPRPARSQAAVAYTLMDAGVLNAVGAPHLSGVNDRGQLSAYGNGHAYRISPLDTNGEGTPDLWYRDNNGDGVNDLLQTLPNPSTKYTWGLARGINGSGQVTGTAQGGSFSPPENAAVWSGSPSGAAQAIGKANDITEGYGINDLGDVAGYLSPKQGGLKATLWRLNGGSYTAVNIGVLPGFDGSLASSVNGARQVVGWLYLNASPKEGFVWTSTGGLQRIGQVPGHLSNMLSAVNDVGEAAGSTNTGQGTHAILWLPQTAYGLPAGLNDIGALTASGGGASGINASGLVIGSSGGHAARWQSGLWQDLNDLTTNLPAGWVLTEAYAISDTGYIAGRANASGVSHAVVLAPQ